MFRNKFSHFRGFTSKFSWKVGVDRRRYWECQTNKAFQKQEHHTNSQTWYGTASGSLIQLRKP